MANRGQVEAVTDSIFFGSIITADGDCGHEIGRCLLLGKKAMTNLNHVLESKGVTLPTKIHIVKAMVCPVVMYGCESWTIMKAEHWTDAFELWCWTKLLRVLWTARRSNQSILKEISPEYSLGRLVLKLQYFGHLMQRTDSLEETLVLEKIEGRWRREWQKIKLIGWHQWINGHELEQTLGDGERQGTLTCWSPWGHKESEMN